MPSAAFVAETSVILAWFSGFAYPVDVARELWIRHERLLWDRAMRHVDGGEAISAREAAGMLAVEASQTRSGRKASLEFVETLIRLDIDPEFDIARDLTLKGAEAMRQDLAKANPKNAAFIQLIKPEQLRGFFAAVQDYWSAPRLIHLISCLSDAELETIHRDVSFLMGIYRVWLRAALHDAATGAEEDTGGLWLWPKIVWQLGRWLMLADIALRRWGLGPHIDAAIVYLQRVFEDPEARRVARACMKQFEEVARLDSRNGDMVRKALEYRSSASPEFKQLMQLGGEAIQDLEELWRPTITGLLEAIDSYFSEGDMAVTGTSGQ